MDRSVRIPSFAVYILFVLDCVRCVSGTMVSDESECACTCDDNTKAEPPILTMGGEVQFVHRGFKSRG